MPNPFVLSIAHPDYKRPYVEQIFGYDEKDIKEKLYDNFYDYLYNTIADEGIEGDVDREYDNYINNYYNYAYMKQAPFELMVLSDSKWIDKGNLVKDIFKKVYWEVLEDIKNES